MKEIKFYVCKYCGKLIRVLNTNNTKTICCGEEMKELVANSVDASLE